MAKKYRITDAEAAKVLIKNVNDRPNALATYGEAKMTPTQVKDLFDRQFMLVKEKHEALADAFEESEETVNENTEKIEELEDKLDNINAKETDPTVPAWAKQPSKPSYTADEVGAADYFWVSELGEKLDNLDYAFNVNKSETLTQISLLISRLDAVANSDDVDLDQLAEIVAYIKSNKTLIEAITTSKVSVSDIVDNLLTNVSNKPLSARMGLELKRMIDKIQVPDSNIPEWALQPEKPSYTADEVGADEKGTADEKVGEHNLSDVAHTDIRLMISMLADRLNALANSSDEDLDQLAEIVAYIKANKNLIDGITTSKVSVSDIIDNLTTNVSNKPLSAKMGVELKKLIDAIKIPTSLPASDVYDWAKQESKPSYNKSEVGLGNVDNVRQYSEINPPPYPVTSVNGQTGAVTVSVPISTSQLTNNSGFITKAVSDLANYYTKSQTYTRDEINSKISAIPKFAIEVVSSLPTSNISVTTVYLVGGGSGNDLYTEYIYANGKWEILGAQTVDLTGYAKESWVITQLGSYLKQSELEAAINTALAVAKASGEFDGYTPVKGVDYFDGTSVTVSSVNTSTADGGSNTVTFSDGKTLTVKNGSKGSSGTSVTHSWSGTTLTVTSASGTSSANLQGGKGDDGETGERGTGVLKVTTAPSSYTTATGGFTPTYRIALSTVLTQSKVAKVLVGDTLAYNYYQYPIGYVDSSYVYLGARTSIRGATGAAASVDDVIAALTAETWTFKLKDGSTVTKQVVIK